MSAASVEHIGLAVNRARETRARRATAPLVVLLHSALAEDAPADEQDTMTQVHAVAGVLERLGFRVRTLAMSRDIAACARRLRQLGPDCVFNLVESVDGRGDAIHMAPTLLESLRLRYTGCDTRAMLLTADKRTGKRLMSGAGIATPALFEAGRAGPGPWIVKSVWEDASIGIDAASIVDDAGACAREIATRAERFGGDWFGEQFVDGREFNIAMLDTPVGPRVLPIAEMCFVDFPPDMPRIVDYAAKWDEQSFAFKNTVRRFDLPASDDRLLRRLKTVALRCWEVFGLSGYARVDVRVDAAGQPWVLELNANPCLSPDAGFAAAAANTCMDFPLLVGSVLENAAPGLLERAREANCDTA